MSDTAADATRPAASAALATMHPAYFAMVMATGIVSTAAHLLGLHAVAVPLFYLNVLFYLAMTALTVLRIVRYPRNVLADLLHHGRSVGFFTAVAATCVLGTQILLIGQSWHVAAALWFAGIVLWALLVYSVFTLLTVKPVKPTLAEGINGGWLVSVVAAQSICVLGAQLAAGFTTHQSHVLFFCLTMWLGGGMLYVWIISLIFYRYTFFPMSPSDLAPPYWINMGAVAISALAGTMLLAAAPHYSVLADLAPFIRGATLLFWATATWWIPMLFILGAWRHVYRRFPLRYDPLYWGAVFPLGMYTACTYRLTEVIDVRFLTPIPKAFIWIALSAWLLTLTGFARHLYLLAHPRKPSASGQSFN